MRVTVRYHAQARAAAKVADETIDLEEACTVAQLFSKLAERHGDELRKIILVPDGRPHPSILLFAGDEQIRCDSPRHLRDGEVVELLSPIAGG